ncbi:hypothetical protein [Mesomycoplasma ovipneumoniae]
MNSKKDKVNVSLLREEAKKTLDHIRKLDAENFSANSEENNPIKIADFTKFENDFNSFIDKIEKNPSADLEQLAKTQLKTKGLDLDKIIKENSKNLKTESSKNTKINSVNFSSYSSSDSMTFEQLANEIWNGHVKSSVFAAINYALTIAYAFSWNFFAVAASATAAGTLTYLAIEYKRAYNDMTNDSEWLRFRYQKIKEFEDWNKRVFIPEVRKAKTRIYSILKTIDVLRKIVLKTRPILVSASWANWKIKLALAVIDVIQNIIWRFVL